MFHFQPPYEIIILHLWTWSFGLNIFELLQSLIYLKAEKVLGRYAFYLHPPHQSLMERNIENSENTSDMGIK